jgi:hypothetical protein
MAGGLNAKQEAFGREFLVDRNRTRAAIRAGYSKASAHSQGWRLMKNADVQQFIAEEEAKLFAKLGIKTERVIEEYAAMAFDRSLPPKDRRANLDRLAKIKGLFIDRVEVQTNVPADELVRRLNAAHVPPPDGESP